MKIYNRMGFTWGVIWTILGTGALILEIIKPSDFLPKQIKDVLISIILVAISISGFIRAFSQSATREDIIEERDERNCLVTLKSKAKTLDILFRFLVGIMFVGIIGYAITRNIAFWGLIIVIPGIFINIYWITYFIIHAYYEKHL